ncbi:MAG: multiheme c-type cytochrome [Ardenticatenaceae bacterium]|nr:multiheme c-type cytochrome [Ardenticatenaceae bacterium]
MSDTQPTLYRWRLLIAGIILVVVFLGLALAASSIAVSRTPEVAANANGRVNVLANSTDSCVECHENTTPGIVDQYGHSTMAAAEVSCQDCHEVEADYPGAIAHEDTHVLREPTTAKCATCHQAEVAQYNQSRHGLPAYVAYAGAQDLEPELLAQYEAIPEGSFNPERMRNALFELQGPEITLFACQSCHDIGKPAPDLSVGQCSKCHMRHEFSLEQARKPETCNACHIGPDHPQWEIYQESQHGIAYATGGHNWNWEAEPGTLTTLDFPAPTCATCHMSGFGSAGTTHDVGDRLTWYLFAPVSERRPAWQDNKIRMQGVCSECHNPNFIEEFYTNADAATERVNEWVVESNEIIAPLKANGLLTDAPFDEPIDFTHFNLWHHWGRTAKFGVWMQGADYVQWHGAYEILHDRAELIEMTNEKLEEAGLEPLVLDE